MPANRRNANEAFYWQCQSQDQHEKVVPLTVDTRPLGRQKSKALKDTV